MNILPLSKIIWKSWFRKPLAVCFANALPSEPYLTQTKTTAVLSQLLTCEARWQDLFCFWEEKPRLKNFNQREKIFGHNQSFETLGRDQPFGGIDFWVRKKFSNRFSFSFRKKILLRTLPTIESLEWNRTKLKFRCCINLSQNNCPKVNCSKVNSPKADSRCPHVKTQLVKRSTCRKKRLDTNKLSKSSLIKPWPTGQVRLGLPGSLCLLFRQI